jgi:hypothetical protein
MVPSMENPRDNLTIVSIADRLEEAAHTLRRLWIEKDRAPPHIPAPGHDLLHV